MHLTVRAMKDIVRPPIMSPNSSEIHLLALFACFPFLLWCVETNFLLCLFTRIDCFGVLVVRALVDVAVELHHLLDGHVLCKANFYN